MAAARYHLLACIGEFAPDPERDCEREDDPRPLCCLRRSSARNRVRSVAVPVVLRNFSMQHVM